VTFSPGGTVNKYFSFTMALPPFKYFS